MRQYAKRMKLHNVFGYNSGRFDLNVLIPYIVNWSARQNAPIEVLKRTNTYITLTVGDIIFKGNFFILFD